MSDEREGRPQINFENPILKRLLEEIGEVFGVPVSNPTVLTEEQQAEKERLEREVKIERGLEQADQREYTEIHESYGKIEIRNPKILALLNSIGDDSGEEKPQP